jgi:uncharacterized membrane protein (DUF106 family)
MFAKCVIIAFIGFITTVIIQIINKTFVEPRKVKKALAKYFPDLDRDRERYLEAERVYHDWYYKKMRMVKSIDALEKELPYYPKDSNDYKTLQESIRKLQNEYVSIKNRLNNARERYLEMSDEMLEKYPFAINVASEELIDENKIEWKNVKSHLERLLLK